MKIINDLFGKKLKIDKIEKKGNVLIVSILNDKYVIKKKKNDINELYYYLSSRGFNNYPKKLFDNKEYNVFEYIESNNSPVEQSAYDFMEAISLLHSKTMYYKDMDIDEYKKIYENISNNIDYEINYYENLIGKIEHSMFMSPSGYLIARNFSKILKSLSFSKDTIVTWYDSVKTSAKKRVVTLHNNADINHIIRNNELYLISFDYSIKGSAIYDLYAFYKKYYNLFDFEELLKHYEKKFKLLEEEKMLFYALITIPEIVKFGPDEISNCKNAKKMVDSLYKTEIFISNYKKA